MKPNCHQLKSLELHTRDQFEIGPFCDISAGPYGGAALPWRSLRAQDKQGHTDGYFKSCGP